MQVSDKTFENKVLDLSLCGTYVYDLQRGLNIYINQQYTRLTGYSLEDINNMSQVEFFELFHPEDQNSISNHFMKLKEAGLGQIMEVEYRFKTFDGKWIWCKSRDAVFDVDENMNAVSLLGSFIDISEQKISEEKMRLTYRRLSVAIEAKSFVIWDYNILSGEIKWDGKVADIYRCNPEEISTYEKWSELIHPDDIEEIELKFQAAELASDLQSVVFRVVLHDGNIRRISSSISIVRNSSWETIGYIGASKDVTLEIENGKKLNQARIELEEVNKKISRDRERLQYYFDTMPSIIVLIDKNRNIEMVNNAACVLFGYEKDELIGNNFLKCLVPPRLIKHAEKLFRKMMEGDIKEHKYMEYWVLCKDGTERLIAWKNSYSLDDNGNIVGSISSGDDITDRHRNEEKNLLLRDFANIVNEAISINDVIKNTIEVICQFTNWPLGHAYFPSPSIHKTIISSGIWNKLKTNQFEDLIAETSQMSFKYGEGVLGKSWKKKKSVWAKGSALKVEYKRKENLEKYGLKGTYIIPIVLNQEVVVILEFFYYESKQENISQLDEFIEDLKGQLETLNIREEYQRKLKEAKLKAEEASKAKSAFLANMSHEIRTPMNAILGHAQILNRDGNLTSYQRDSIDTINRSGRHLLGLINEVLNMSKIEMGKMELRYTNFNLIDLIKELIDMFQFDLRKKNIRLTFEKSSSVPLYINSDQNKVRQILINLLANAIKFTEYGSVLVKLDYSANRVFVIVSDTGVGIPSDKLDKVFESFEQADAGISKGGTGLGLSISRKMARILKGDIRVESRINKGSKFSFSFPVLQKSDSLKKMKSKADVIRIKQGQRAPKVLIVDDMLENRAVLEIFLRAIGFEVKSAVNGKEGVELFKTWSPEIILMDMVMPVMDGIKATKMIRQLDTEGKVGIIAVSASAFDEERDEILEIGANAFIRKPYEESELLEEIKNCIDIEYEYKKTKKVKRMYANKKELGKASSYFLEVQRRQIINAINEGDLEKVEVLSKPLKKKNKKLYKYIQDQLEEMELEELHSLFK